MLGHLLHDEWIADHKPDDLRFFETCLLANHRAMIKFQEQHQTCFPHVSVDHFLQLGERARGFGSARERGQIQLSDTSFQGGHHRLEWSCCCKTEALYFDFSNWHWIVPFGLMLALKTRGLHLGEAAIDKQLCPRHVARIIRCEKHYCFGDLIRLSEPAERYYIRDHFQPLLSCL